MLRVDCAISRTSVKSPCNARIFRNLLSGAAKHDADGCKNLAKFVVEFARDVAKRGLLRVNEFLRQFAALIREKFKAGKDFAIRIDQVKAGQHDGNERGTKQNVELALNAIIDLGDLVGGLFFAFVVLHEQTRYGSAESGLTSLQSELYLVASFLFIADAGSLKHAIDGVPKLSERLIEELALVGSTRGGRELFFEGEGSVEILADACKLRDPGSERIGFAGIEHVAHGEAQDVEIVLHAEKLERIAAIAIHHVTLQGPETGKLRARVKGVDEDGDQRQNEAQEQTCGGGRLRGRGLSHWQRITCVRGSGKREGL